MKALMCDCVHKVNETEEYKFSVCKYVYLLWLVESYFMIHNVYTVIMKELPYYQ